MTESATTTRIEMFRDSASECDALRAKTKSLAEASRLRSKAAGYRALADAEEWLRGLPINTRPSR